jgi:predicted nucleic acid-binding protein
MKPMHARYFLDSNIFLYAFSTKETHKQTIAKELLLNNAIISTQVVNETCSNLLKKLAFNETQVQAFIESCYSRYFIADVNQKVFMRASHLREHYLLSYYDSTIVAAALLSDCVILYSEDMQHKQVIDSTLTIINPFL